MINTQNYTRILLFKKPNIALTELGTDHGLIAPATLCWFALSVLNSAESAMPRPHYVAECKKWG